MVSHKKLSPELSPAARPQDDPDEEDQPNASPFLRNHFGWIDDGAVQRFPQAIREIEYQCPIPQQERDRVAGQLIDAAGVWRQRAEGVRLSPSKQAKFFEDIAVSSTQLLKRLGFEDWALPASGLPKGGLPSPLGLLLPTLQQVAVERRGDAAWMAAMTRAATLCVLLSDLAEAAKREARRETPYTDLVPPRRGRGGARRQGPGADGELVNAILEIYAGVRKRCPRSGPKPAFGGPMIQFVQACLCVVNPDLSKKMTSSAIRGYFNRWRAK